MRRRDMHAVVVCRCSTIIQTSRQQESCQVFSFSAFQDFTILKCCCFAYGRKSKEKSLETALFKFRKHFITMLTLLLLMVLFLFRFSTLRLKVSSGTNVFEVFNYVITFHLGSIRFSCWASTCSILFLEIGQLYTSLSSISLNFLVVLF